MPRGKHTPMTAREQSQYLSITKKLHQDVRRILAECDGSIRTVVEAHRCNPAVFHTSLYRLQNTQNITLAMLVKLAAAVGHNLVVKLEPQKLKF